MNGSRNPSIVVLGLTVGAVLLLMGLLQVVWGLGVTTWPLPDREALAETVVNVPPDQLPPAWTTVGLGIFIIMGGLVAVGRVGLLGRRLPRWPFTAGIWVVAATLLLRGFSGLLDSGLFVSQIDSPYARWDAAVYSPLSVLLGILSVVVAVSRLPGRSRRRHGAQRKASQHAPPTS